LIDRRVKYLMNEFSLTVRVYYEDTDAAGLVYHSNYLKYMERARTEYLRTLGHNHSRLRERHEILFVVKHMNIDFKKPAGLDDELNVSATISKSAGAGLTFYHTIKKDEERVCEAEINIVCLDANNYLPKRIPASLFPDLNNDA